MNRVDAFMFPATAGLYFGLGILTFDVSRPIASIFFGVMLSLILRFAYRLTASVNQSVETEGR